MTDVSERQLRQGYVSGEVLKELLAKGWQITDTQVITSSKDNQTMVCLVTLKSGSDKMTLPVLNCTEVRDLIRRANQDTYRKRGL
jgi:hypothetical protein